MGDHLHHVLARSIMGLRLQSDLDIVSGCAGERGNCSTNVYTLTVNKISYILTTLPNCMRLTQIERMCGAGGKAASTAAEPQWIRDWAMLDVF